MFRKLTAWKFVLALLTVTAFAAAAGHESAHIGRDKHCAVCHVKQVDPAAAAASGSTLSFLIVLFFVLIIVRQAPLSSTRPRPAGRSPPVSLS